MDTITFLASVVLITASGALAPGPLFFATIVQGVRDGARAGFSFSVGHTVVEFPLILLLAFGFTAASQSALARTVGVVGGVALIVFGAYQIYGSLRSGNSGLGWRGTEAHRASLLMGLALTALNPFFILWWMTVGSKLVVDALLFASLAGVLIMYAAHVWLDYVWLTSVAHFAKKGANLLGTRWYRAVLALLGVILVYFGFSFFTSAI